MKQILITGGWAAMALRSSGLEGKREQLNDGASGFLRCPVSFHDFAWKGTPRGEWI